MIKYFLKSNTKTLYYSTQIDFIGRLKQEIHNNKMSIKEIAKKAKCKQSDIEKFLNDEIEVINVLRGVINYLFITK